MTWNEVYDYLKSKGLRRDQDYSLNEEIENIEFYKVHNRTPAKWKCEYFVSVGTYKSGVYEVFELHHGAEVDENDHYVTDGQIWQYKTYESLKRAIDFAVDCLNKNKLPSKPIMVW